MSAMLIYRGAADLSVMEFLVGDSLNGRGYFSNNNNFYDK